MTRTRTVSPCPTDLGSTATLNAGVGGDVDAGVAVAVRVADGVADAPAAVALSVGLEGVPDGDGSPVVAVGVALALRPEFAVMVTEGGSAGRGAHANVSVASATRANRSAAGIERWPDRGRSAGSHQMVETRSGELRMPVAKPSA